MEKVIFLHLVPNVQHVLIVLTSFVQTGSLIGAAPPPDTVDMLRRATASPFDNLVGALDGPAGGGGGMHMMPDPIGPSGPGGPPPQYGMGMGGGGGGYYPYSGQSEGLDLDLIYNHNINLRIN